MPILGKLKEFLDANGVAYEVRTHIPAFTAQEIAAAQHVPGREMAKVVNLKANPRAAVTVDLYSDAWAHLKGVMVQGTARLLERGPRFRKARALLYRKYPHYPDEAALEESESVIVEVSPTRVFSWGLE